MFERITRWSNRARVACLAAFIGTVPAAFAQSYIWRNVEIGGGGFVTGTVFHPTEPGLVYARTDVGGAYRLDAATNRWIALNDEVGGLNNEFQHQGVISIGLDPNDANRVYIATGQYAGAETWKLPSRIYRSTDRGNTWSYITPGFKMGGNGEGRGTGERMAVDPLNGANILVGSNNAGIWRSTNYGASFTQLASFPLTNLNFVLYAPASHHNPGPNRRVYAGANTLTGQSFWFSDDNGTTWAEVPNHPGKTIGMETMPLQGSFDAAGVFYLTWGDATGPGNSATDYGVWKLSADASTWTSILPPTGQGFFGGISADPRVAGHVVVSTLNRWWPGDEVYRSTDGGATWIAALRTASRSAGNSPWSANVGPHWITDIDIDPFDSNRAIFNTGFGLFQSGNLSASGTARLWTFFNDGLEETVPLGLHSPTAGPQLISVIGDYTGFRHDRLDRSPLRGSLSPGAGSTSKITGASLAPEKMIRQNSSSTYYSQDAGATWAAFPAQPATVANGHGTAVLSADGQRIVWCPVTSEAYFSTDNGATWSAAVGTSLGVTLTPIADRVNPQLFYLWNNTAKSLLVSTDGGQNFTTASSGLNSNFAIFRSVPHNAGHLWVAANDGGLYRSTNTGASFAKLSNVASAYRVAFGKAAPSATHPAVFIWGKIGTVVGFFRSDDAGATWVRINDDLHNFGYQNDLEADPRVFGRVYLATSGRGVIVGDIANPPAPAPQATELLYADGPAAAWSNSSVGGTDLLSSQPVRRGNAAIQVPAGSGKGVSLDCAPRPVSGMAAISFWAKAESGDLPPLQIGASRGGIALEAQPIAVPTGPGWHRIQVPLADIGLAGVEDLTGLRIESRTVAGVVPGAFAIDDIVLVSAGDFGVEPPAVAINLTGLTATYDGTPKPVTVLTNPLSTPVSVTYDGSAAVPVSGGSYAVLAVVDDPLATSSASATLTINKAEAGVTFDTLVAVYDGSPKPASAVTNPAGLALSFTYDGAAGAPVNPGSYVVTATVQDNNYQGSATAVWVVIDDQTAYDNWRFANFGTYQNSGSAADGADPDGDGFSNAEEYAAGTNALSASSFPAPRVMITSPTMAAVALPDPSIDLRVKAAVLPAQTTLPVTVAWTMNAGPDEVVFADASALETTVTFPAAGNYQLQCAVSLGAGAQVQTGSAVFSVSVAMPATYTFRQGVNGYSHTATIIRADNTAWNSGARDQIIVGKTSSNLRSIFSFDLSAIPAGSEIASTQLDLWTSSTAGSGTVGTLDLRELLGIPVEGTGDGINASSGVGTGATWASRTGLTTAGNLWNAPGGDFASAVLSSVPGFAASATGAQKTFASSSAFVATVQAALNASQPLNLMFHSPATEAGPATQFARFASDDAATIAQRPLLTVSIVEHRVPTLAVSPVPVASPGVAVSLTASAVEADSVGWSQLSGPGTATFANASQANTSVTFDQPGIYQLALAAGNSHGESSVTLAVTVNAPPTAPGASLTVAANTPGLIVLPMSDPDGDPVSVSSFTQGSHGAVTVDGDTATYTSAANFVGEDAFTYTVGDGRGGSATGVVTVTVNDVTAPVVSVPSNMTVEATGPSGAVAMFSTSALDDIDGPLPTFNQPGSGSVFPLGTTAVTATATDAAGNTGSASFAVTVRDTTPPAITVPANITVVATDGNGAVVNFSTSAVDAVSGMVATVNTPASGSVFPIGTTTVTTTAADAAGNPASRTFTVTVNSSNSAPVLASIGAKGVQQGQLLTFTASAADPDVPAQSLAYSLDSGAPAGAAIHPATGVFTWTPSGSQAPGNYSVTVRVTDNGSPALSDSETITITVTSSLPAPWVAADIGTVGLAGSASFNAGAYTLLGAGTGISGTSDGCHFVYQPASGDCSVTIRVESLTNTGSNAKAGVMIRESLSANSRAAGVWVTPSGGIHFTRRTSAGGTTALTTTSGVAAPYWVRLTRTGSTFKAFMSANGTSWTQVGKNVNISMAANTSIGIAVTSGTTATRCTSVMTNEAVSP